MFIKTLTAGVLAISLTLTSLTPTTATARVSDEDAVVGVLALLLLGAAIHNSRGNDTPTVAPTPPRPVVATQWRVLPSSCLRRVENRRGETVRFFGQRCLTNNYRHVNRLPQACHIQFRTENGQRRQGFNPRCLRNAGFRTTRH